MNHYKFVLKIRRIPSLKVPKNPTREMLELQIRANSYFLVKLKLFLFYINLEAIGVIVNACMRGWYSPNFIEKFIVMKEKFDFEIEA